MVIIKNRTLLFSNKEQYIGTPYDNYSTVRTFSLNRVNGNGVDISHLQFYINIGRLDKTENTDELVKEVTDDKIILTWSISEQLLKQPGTAFIGIRAHDLSGVVKWATYPAPVYIGNVLDLPESGEGTLNVLEKLEAKFKAIEETEETRIAAEAEREEAETARKEAERQREENALKLEEEMAAATTAAKEATEETRSATEEANSATKSANDAADRTNEAIESAGRAAEAANTAAQSVDEIKKRAEQAAEAAETATETANSAAENANTKAQLAGEAIEKTNQATESALEAAERANSAASNKADDTLSNAGMAADAKKVGEEITRLDEENADIKAMISDAYSDSATYAVGDYCIYDQAMYKCTVGISEPEEFAPVHWERVSVAGEMKEIARKIKEDYRETAEELQTIINDINDGVDVRTQTKDTVFNSDGSITETLADGRVKTTVFNSDGSITETLADGDKVLWTGVTTFNADGSIKEEVR